MIKYGRLNPLRREEISIKQKERVQKYGEVFTPSNIVKDMLDLLPVADGGKSLVTNTKTKTKKPYISSTFLEPSCGDGNFLVEILNRKLKCVSESYCGGYTGNPKLGIYKDKETNKWVVEKPRERSNKVRKCTFNSYEDMYNYLDKVYKR